MPKVKIKKKQIKDEGITQMFNQMLGVDGVNPDIVIPKYKTISTKIKAVIKLLRFSVEDTFSKFGDQKDSSDKILTYCNTLSEIKFLDTKDNSPENITLMANHYVKLKSNNDIRFLILTCKNLITYKNFLNDLEDNGSFILREPGFTFCPFPFSDLNIKAIWQNKNVTIKIKKYILTVMRIMLNNCMVIYKTLTSPDVDVSEFSEIIVKSIANIKKQIPRCEKAFDQIEKSISLLENNFDGYYKDFIQSQNPSTIIESFVIDVSDSTKADPQTTRQFRKIINFYREKTQGKIKDPKLKAVFDALNSNINAMNMDNKEDPKDK